MGLYIVAIFHFSVKILVDQMVEVLLRVLHIDQGKN